MNIAGIFFGYRIYEEEAKDTMRLKGKRTVMAAGLSLLLTISPIAVSAFRLETAAAVERSERS